MASPEQGTSAPTSLAHDLVSRLALVTSALTHASPPPAESGGIVLRQAEAGLGAAAAMVGMLTDDGKVAHLASSGFPAEVVDRWPLPVTAGWAATDAVRYGESVSLASAAERDERYPGQAITALPFDASVFVPLKAGNQTVGVLGVAFDGPRTLDPTERLFLETLAGLLAAALGTTRVRPAPSPPFGEAACEHARVVAERLSERFGGDGCIVAAVDRDAGRLGLLGAAFPDRAAVEAIREGAAAGVLVGEHLAAQLLADRQPIFLASVEPSSIPASAPARFAEFAARWPVYGVIGVPIPSPPASTGAGTDTDEPLGILVIVRLRAGDPFAPTDLDVLEDAAADLGRGLVEAGLSGRKATETRPADERRPAQRESAIAAPTEQRWLATAFAVATPVLLTVVLAVREAEPGFAAGAAYVALLVATSTLVGFRRGAAAAAVSLVCIWGALYEPSLSLTSEPGEAPSLFVFAAAALAALLLVRKLDHATRAQAQAETAAAENGAQLLQRELDARRAQDAANLRYRSLIEATTSVVWTNDPSGAFAEYQPGWESYTGQRWADHAGFGWTAAIHPDDLAGVRQAWQAATAAGEGYEASARLWHAASGEHRWTVARAVPIKEASGAVREWIGTITDIHDRRTLEARVEETAGLLETLLRTAPVGFAFLDRDLRYVLLNDHLAEASGIPIDEHLGRTLHEVSPEWAARVEPLMRRVLDDGEPLLGCEIGGDTSARPGVHRDWVISYYPVRGPAAAIIGVGCTVVEVTERNRWLQAEQDARRLAEEAALRADQLQRITAAIAVAATVSDVASAVVDATLGALGAQSGSVSLLAPDGRTLDLAAADGFPAEVVRRFQRVDGRQSPWVSRVLDGEPAFFDDVEEFQRLQPESLFLRAAPDVRAWCLMPLIGGGRAFGTLGMNFTRPHTFTDDDRRFLGLVASLAGEAIRRATALDRESAARRQAEEAAARAGSLQRIASALAVSSTPHDIAAVVATEARIALGACGAAVAVLGDDRTTHLRIEAVGAAVDVGPGAHELAADQRSPLAETVCEGRAAYRQTPEGFDDAYPRLAVDRDRRGIQGWADLPLVGDGGLIGALQITFPAATSFPPDDRVFLETIADLAAQALQRNQLHRAERAVRDRLARLQSISDIAIGQHALPELLDELVVRLREVLGVDRVRILLADEHGLQLRAGSAVPDAGLATGGFPHEVTVGDGFTGRVAAGTGPLIEDAPAGDPGSLSRAAVAMRSGARLVGVVEVGAAPPRRFGDDDVELLRLAGERIAVAIERSAAVDAEQRAAAAVRTAYVERDRVARSLQASLLPPTLPDVPGVALAARYIPSGDDVIGGDFYDVFETHDGTWHVVLGDVCGKGPDAAALTGLARYTARAAAIRQDGPADILRLVNEAVLRDGTDRFCTMADVALSRDEDGALAACLSLGGHPQPRLLRVADGSLARAGRHGTIIGVLHDATFHDSEHRLEPGDMLVLFTDGLVERAPGLDERRLDELLAESAAARHSADVVADRLMDALHDAGTVRDDDVAIVVIQALP